MKPSSLRSPPNPKGRGVDEFRASHDKRFIVPKRIEAALAELGEAWEYEGEFIRRCKLSTTDFALARAKYLAHAVTVNGRQGSTGKRVWCGTVAYAAKLRKISEA